MTRRASKAKDLTPEQRRNHLVRSIIDDPRGSWIAAKDALDALVQGVFPGGVYLSYEAWGALLLLRGYVAQMPGNDTDGYRPFIENWHAEHPGRAFKEGNWWLALDKLRTWLTLGKHAGPTHALESMEWANSGGP